MRKNFLLLSFLIVFQYGFSQKAVMKGAMMNVVWENETHVIRCSDFRITKPLREIAAEHSFSEEKNYSFAEYPDEEGRPIQTFEYTVEKDGIKYGNNPSLIQRDFGKSKSGKALLQNWEGQVASGFRPFDPSGAAGVTYYIQMINATTYTIYNKSDGTEVLSGTLGDLWTPATGNAGDPIVLYDKEAGRWFLSQFGNSNEMFIAISQTGDPTGAWYTYTFTSPDFPDYLKFSAWQDGYYMTANYAQKIFAFNRDKMLAGDGTAEAVYQTFSPPQSGFFVPLPADASDGLMPGAGTPCPVFSYSDDGWGGGNIDAVNIYNASVDWGTLDMTVTSAGAIPTDAFDASYDSNWLDIPQPGTTQKLDGIGGCLMYRAQWKKWTGYNSVVLSWAVKISADQRGIFWCELRQSQADDTWSMYQQGIYAPGTDYYWMSSAAMNDMGDIALCYAKANGTDTYMSLAYTGRKAGDALGTMTLAETVVQAGESSQTSSKRDGDYAQTSLDPDGVTFWHTGEYMKSGGSAGTRIYSFQISDPVNPNLSAQGVSTTQVDLSWTLNSNNEPALIAWSSDGTFGTPVDGTTYNAGDNIPGGGIVLSYGTSPTTYSHTGLTAATTYYYRAWSYQTNNTYTNGITTQAETFTGNPENLSALGVSVSEIDLNWDLNSNSDNVLLAWSSDGTFGTPVDGTTYNTGDNIPGGGIVLSYGTATSYNHTGLSGTTQYFYKAWSDLDGTSYSTGVVADAETYCDLVIASLPYSEDFSSQTLPDCWENVDNAGLGQVWEFNNPGNITFNSTTSANGFVILDSDNYGTGGAQNADLITNIFDFSSYNGINVSFEHYYNDWASDDESATFSYSIDGGATWTDYKVWEGTDTSNPEVFNADLSSEVGGQSSVKFKWTYADGSFSYYWAIDDIKITEIDVTAVNNQERSDIIISPNPSSGIFTIQGIPSDSKYIEVYNLAGKIILSEKVNSEKIHIDLSNREKGIYFVKIFQENKIFVSKVVVQ